MTENNPLGIWLIDNIGIKYHPSDRDIQLSFIQVLESIAEDKSFPKVLRLGAMGRLPSPGTSVATFNSIALNKSQPLYIRSPALQKCADPLTRYTIAIDISDSTSLRVDAVSLISMDDPLLVIMALDATQKRHVRLAAIQSMRSTNKTILNIALDPSQPNYMRTGSLHVLGYRTPVPVKLMACFDFDGVPPISVLRKYLNLSTNLHYFY